MKRPINRYHWHDWFAWFPVNVEGPRPGTRCWCWLETIERRRVGAYAGDFWEYRADWEGMTIT